MAAKSHAFAITNKASALLFMVSVTKGHFDVSQSRFLMPINAAYLYPK